LKRYIYGDRFCKIACIGETKKGQCFDEEKGKKKFRYEFLESDENLFNYQYQIKQETKSFLESFRITGAKANLGNKHR